MNYEAFPPPPNSSGADAAPIDVDGGYDEEPPRARRRPSARQMTIAATGLGIITGGVLGAAGLAILADDQPNVTTNSSQTASPAASPAGIPAGSQANAGTNGTHSAPADSDQSGVQPSDGGFRPGPGAFGGDHHGPSSGSATSGGPSSGGSQSGGMTTSGAATGASHTQSGGS